MLNLHERLVAEDNQSVETGVMYISVLKSVTKHLDSVENCQPELLLLLMLLSLPWRQWASVSTVSDIGDIGCHIKIHTTIWYQFSLKHYRSSTIVMIVPVLFIINIEQLLVATSNQINKRELDETNRIIIMN